MSHPGPEQITRLQPVNIYQSVGTMLVQEPHMCNIIKSSNHGINYLINSMTHQGGSEDNTTCYYPLACHQTSRQQDNTDYNSVHPPCAKLCLCHCSVSCIVSFLDMNASAGCKIETILCAYFAGQQILRSASGEKLTRETVYWL